MRCLYETQQLKTMKKLKNPKEFNVTDHKDIIFKIRVIEMKQEYIIFFKKNKFCLLMRESHKILRFNTLNTK